MMKSVLREIKLNCVHQILNLAAWLLLALLTLYLKVAECMGLVNI